MFLIRTDGLQLVLSLILLTAIGCAGSRPDLNPMASEVDRLQEEARGFSEDETSAGLLETSRSLSLQYEAARDQDEWDQASSAIQEARASGRT